MDESGNIYVTGYSNGTWGSPLNSYTGAGTSDVVIMKLDSFGNLEWHTFYGSGNSDGGSGIAVDESGNIYVTGYSKDTWGSPLNPYTGDVDIVIMKLDSSGNLLWHTFYGSGNSDAGNGIALDESGNIYVTGYSKDTWGSPLNPYTGSYDIMIMKLDSSGNLTWNTFYGSGDDDLGNDIALDENGNIYVTGYSKNTWGSPLNPYTGSDDIVVLKLSQIMLTVLRLGTGSGRVISYPSGIDCGDDCKEIYEEGTVVTLKAIPDPGSVFTGWGGDCSECGANSSCQITMDSNKTCTATFSVEDTGGCFISTIVYDSYPDFHVGAFRKRYSVKQRNQRQKGQR